MEKNTEYGALALLSASSYGMGSTPITDGGSTTGNKTGVVMKLNDEWVVAGCADFEGFKSVNGRYKNIYTTTYVEKAGDAIATVGSWHGATEHSWFDIQTDSRMLCRARSNQSIFSYNASAGSSGTSSTLHPRHTRAVVVVGSGV